MNIPQIKIHQGFTQIGLSSDRPIQSIEQPKAELNTKQNFGKLAVEREPGRLEVDSRKAWSALARTNFNEFTERIAQESFHISMQNIAEIAQEGDQMMAIHTPNNAFADIARQNAFKDFYMELRGEPGYDNVDVQFIPDQINVSFTGGEVHFDPVVHKPVIHYSPGKVNPYILQKNFISISHEGQYLQAYI